MAAVLGPHADADWDVEAGSLEWSCWEVAAHVAHDLMTYAAQLMARRTSRYLPMRLVVTPGTSPDAVMEVVRASGRLLSSAVSAAGADARAWHWGMSDASGFAAMGIGEVLVHTFDIAVGLGVGWRPPDDLAGLVVARLLPDAPSGAGGDVLLWATGRSPLGAQPPATSWKWKAAR